MRKKNIRFGIGVAVCCFLMGAIVFGCSPAMRKKFIRERKEPQNQDAVVPILEPTEYANAIETVRARYDYFYALLRVWHKDAVILAEEGASDRQMRYTLDQMKMQLQELMVMLGGASRQTAERGMGELADLLKEYDRPVSLRNSSMMLGNIQKLTDTVIQPLAFDHVQTDLR